MANLIIQAIENAGGQQGYLPAASGLTVNAYLASQFPAIPTPASFNPRMSAAATATTGAGGVATLTGLSASTAYAVCVIDKGGEPHFEVYPASYVGDGITHVLRYIPAPAVATPSVALASARMTTGSATFNITGTNVSETLTSWTGTPDWADAPFSWDSTHHGWQTSEGGIILVTCQLNALDAGAGGYPYGASAGFNSDGSDSAGPLGGNLWIPGNSALATISLSGLWKAAAGDTLYVVVAPPSTASGSLIYGGSSAQRCVFDVAYLAAS